MPIFPQALLRSELLACLNSRVAATEDEVCLLLAQRPLLSEAAALDQAQFRSEVRNACQVLHEDGLVVPGGGGQWRIVRLRDAAESPDEVPASSAPYYSEQASVTVRTNKYERDRSARKLCIEHYGARCAVCDFDFEQAYGPLGQGCIRVHHIVPPARIGAGYKLDAVRDLRPVCANCHYMIHRIEPAYGIEQLRELLLRHQASMPGEAGAAPGGRSVWQ